MLRVARESWNAVAGGGCDHLQNRIAKSLAERVPGSQSRDSQISPSDFLLSDSVGVLRGSEIAYRWV